MASFKFRPINHFSPVEMFLVLAFIVFILFPINLPAMASNNMFAYLFYLAITIVLFVKFNPVLGVLYIFVVYEIIRRGSSPVYATTDSPKFSETMVSQIAPIEHTEVDKATALLGGSHEPTLEEEMIGQMAPVGKSVEVKSGESEYYPVNSKLDGASLYK